MAVITNATLKAQRIESTQVTGVSPLVVASTTATTNLNADLLDGQTGTYYTNADNLASGTVPSARIAGAYTGITQVGTLTAGTWNATAIGPTYGGTGLTSYTLGDIPYASAANTLAALAGNTTTAKQFLSQTGNGTISAAPAWATIAAGDIGSGTFADARIAESNVTQHEAALSIAYSQLSDSSAVLDAVQALSALGTAGQIIKVDSGGTGLEFTSAATDAFASVENSAGTEQFAASGADAIQFAAGSDLSVAFDAVNKRVTFSYTGAGGGGMTGLAVKKEDVLIGTRTGINLHEGSGVTLTVTDDAGNSEVDITIAASTVAALDDLSDVTITSAATGDLLRYNGSAWVNTSALDVVGDFSVATDKFTVASATGNTAVAGTLGVTGAATLSSTLAVTGITTFTTYIQGTTGNGYLDLRGDSAASSLVRIADTGNIWVGATPGFSSWDATHRVIESNETAFHFVGSGNVNMLCNGYFDGSNWRYMATAGASRVNAATSGTWIYSAVSGTAGNVLSWVLGIKVSGAGVVEFPSIGTTASAANAFLDSANSNRLLRSTSSLRYKRVLHDLSVEESRAIVSAIRPFAYHSLAANDEGREFVGIGAEHVDAIDPRFVHYDSDGRPDGLMYDRFVAPLIVVAQDHEARIAALETQLAA